jgi:hypothetical protein
MFIYKTALAKFGHRQDTKVKKSLSILQNFGYMLEHLEAIEKLFGNFLKIFISGKEIGD